MVTRTGIISAVVSASVLFVANASRAQDPTVALPDAYQVQFENAHVRVVRVHYPAGAKLPDHTHPAGTTLYVYLNDSDGVVFRHSGGMNHVVKRPPVKAGSVRIATGHEEHHTAENTSESPAHALRIQLKTATNTRAHRRIPAGVFRGETAMSVEFTSDAFVIQRYFVAPGQTVEAQPVDRPAPALWIAIPSGETRWSDTAQEKVSNDGAAPMELLRVIVR